MNDLIYERLKEAARQGKTMAYPEVARLADLDGDDTADLAKLVTILEEIAEEDVQAGRPLLVIIVLGTKTNMPGKGLFKWAAKHKLYSGGDDLAFFASELRRVHEFWKNQPV